MHSTFFKILPRSDQMFLSTAWLKAWPQLHHTPILSQQIYCQLLTTFCQLLSHSQLLLPWQQSDVLPSEVSHHLQCSMVFPQCGAPGIRPIRLPQWQSMRPSNTEACCMHTECLWIESNCWKNTQQYDTDSIIKELWLCVITGMGGYINSLRLNNAYMHQ